MVQPAGEGRWWKHVRGVLMGDRVPGIGLLQGAGLADGSHYNRSGCMCVLLESTLVTEAVGV